MRLFFDRVLDRRSRVERVGIVLGQRVPAGVWSRGDRFVDNVVQGGQDIMQVMVTVDDAVVVDVAYIVKAESG